MGGYVKTAVFRINADGTGRTPITKAVGGDSDPAWSPDGKQILVTSLQDAGRRHIYMMDSNGDNRVLLSSSAGAIDSQARWSPEGDKIIFVTMAGKLPIVFTGSADPANLWRLEFSNFPNASTMSPDWSNHNIIYVNYSRGQVVICPEEMRFSCANETGVLTPAYQGTTVARFSPDGQSVLFDMDVKNNRDIYLLPIVGAGDPRRITIDKSLETDPAWRPIPS